MLIRVKFVVLTANLSLKYSFFNFATQFKKNWRWTPKLGQPEGKISSKSAYWETWGIRQPQWTEEGDHSKPHPVPGRQEKNTLGFSKSRFVARQIDMWNRSLLWSDDFAFLSHSLIIHMRNDYPPSSEVLCRESFRGYTWWKQFYKRESTFRWTYRPVYGALCYPFPECRHQAALANGWGKPS